MNTDQEWDLDTPVVGGALVCPQCGDLFSPFCERCPDDGASLEPQLLHPDPMIGTVLDRRFRILRTLAEGSMGRVYEGVQLPDKRPVAIKIIREELVRDPLAAQRFLREVRMLMRITHPNIVEVCDYGDQDGSLFFVMELLRGNS